MPGEVDCEGSTSDDRGISEPHGRTHDGSDPCSAHLRGRRSLRNLIFDTETGDALVGGPVDDAAAAALGFPPGEGVIRIAANKVPGLLYGLGPETLGGDVLT